MTVLQDNATFALGHLARLLTDRGLAATIEHTGGNVATLHVARDAAALDRSLTEDDAPNVTVGPGTYLWSDPEASPASLHELSASAHPRGWEDDEGETVYFDAEWSFTAIADEIARLVGGLPTARA
ncbi:MAG TPA: hypothetical protein VF062_22385 [Candidatus Limnocylindrales bacterium]